MVLLKLISILLGYTLAVVLASVLTRNEQWVLVVISLIITFFEIYSSYYYKHFPRQYSQSKFIFTNINYLKIGLIYGLFMDGFKIGS